MISEFDATAILAYKIMSDCDYLNKRQFTHDELEKYYLNVINYAAKINIEISFMSEEHILEIKNRLSSFCDFKDNKISISPNLKKSKAKQLAKLYIKALDFQLYACCETAYAEEFEAENTRNLYGKER